MPSNWSWWDAWKSGDPDESKRALDAETDRSLAKDPDRWHWGKSVEETVERPSRGRGGHTADRRHHTGKGHVRGGESGERGTWSDREWDRARDDYQRQNPRDDRDHRDDDRHDDRGWFW